VLRKNFYYLWTYTDVHGIVLCLERRNTVMKILDKLFGGEYYPLENSVPDTEEYRETLHQLADKSASLEESFTDEQMALFEEYSNLKSHCELLARRKMYADAVRFGIGIMLETMYPGQKPSCLPDEE